MRHLFSLGFLVCMQLFVAACNVPVAVVEDGFLIVSPEHGLSNRLKALSASYAVSKITKRQLRVDWQRDPEHFNFAFNDLFENELPMLTSNEIFQSLKKSKVSGPENPNFAYYTWQAKPLNLSQIPSDAAKVIYVSSQNFYGQELGAHWDAYVLEFLQQLRPVPEVAQRIEAFRSQHFNERQVIGIHYRGWKDSVDHAFNLESAPYRIFVDEMRRQSERVGQHVFFYVATDDIGFLAFVKAEFGEEHILSLDLPADRHSLEGIRSALVDWFLLASTDFIVGTRGSTFSDLASWLTKTRTKIDLGPDVWSKK